MSEILDGLVDGLVSGQIEVVDLTTPLSAEVPVQLFPEPLGQCWPFELAEISRYDDRGNWYWNNIRTGEHTGTHFDAPVHAASGRFGLDVSEVPARRLVAPAVVLDFAGHAGDDPDFLLEIEHVEKWTAEFGPLPEEGWVFYRTGWDARAGDAAGFLNGGRWPGISPECARWLANDTPVLGFGVETVGTDAGTASSLDPPFPCHSYFLGAGKFGLTMLRNLAQLPARGAVVLAGPLPIVGGSGSPCRVLALVGR